MPGPVTAREAAAVLARIAALLELRGENRFKAGAYERAARAVSRLAAGDLAPLVADGTIAGLAGVGPATHAVLEELAATGRSAYLDRLRADLPESLVALLRVPGLTPAAIHRIHDALGIASLEALESAAQDGRLTKVKGIGPAGAKRILDGIATARAAAGRRRFPDARAEAEATAATLRAADGVLRVHVAGEVRRRCEVAAGVTLVVVAQARPAAERVARAARRVDDDGWVVDVRAAGTATEAVALWRATGSDAHVALVEEALAARGMHIADDDAVHDASGAVVRIADEAALYRLAALAFVPPELREAQGEVDAATGDAIPALLAPDDIQGVLHAHSTWSDGKNTVREMADGARARGWRYLAITDHSQAAAYAGGLTPDRVREQHAEIDALDTELAPEGFRLLKGVEADILADGRLDYGDAFLAGFDVVVGSVHSRFRMSEREMTDRMLTALDSPHLTILGHPTGRLLLSRAAYALDVDAVLARAAERGVAVEINADPHRLDLDWRHVRRALELGVTLAIGPDAHSVNGLDNVAYGVGIARKGWATRADVLNAQSVETVLGWRKRKR